MSFQITEAFVQQYNSTVSLVSQQKQSRLEPAVRVETIRGTREAFDSIGTVEAQPRGGRHADTPQMDTPHMRRWVTSAPYNWADLVDKPDRLRMLYDPTSPYVQNAVMAFNRAKDKIIINAAFAPAWTGEHGDVQKTFPTSNIIPHGDTGLTIEKLIQARGMLWRNEVDESEPLFAAVTSFQLEDMLNNTKVQSADYNTIKALVRGEINSFMGFTFIRTEQLEKDGAARKCIVWSKPGLLLAKAEDITTKISERGDKNYSTQVYAEMDLGAVRMEDEKVLQLQCKEGA